MTAIGWETVGGSHRHDRYRIDPAGGEPPGGWVIRVDDGEHPVLETIDAQRFSSLKAAKAAAIHHRILTIRRTKLIRHALLAVLGVLFTVPAFALMGPGASTRRVVFFVVGLAVLLVALREMVGLLMIALSHGWDYGYDTPEVTFVDRAVAGFVGVVGRVPLPADTSGEAAVHVVSLD